MQLPQLGTLRLGLLLVVVLHHGQDRVQDESCVLGHKVGVHAGVGLHVLLHVSEVGVENTDQADKRKIIKLI